MNILVKPIITEKMTAQGDKFSRFGFVVDHRANKIDIKKAVEQMYGVTVEKVNTANYIGKVKTRNTTKGMAIGTVNCYKKATVQLAKGESIDFYSNI